MIKKRFVKFTLLVFGFALVFCVRLFMLQKSSHPNGLDGYFYALQAKSFVETGRLENQSHEIGYYICGAFAFVTKNPMLGVKIWAAASSELVSLAIFFVVFARAKKFSLSFIGFFLSAVSPTFAVMGINFINNQTGILFLLLYVTLLLQVAHQIQGCQHKIRLILRILLCVMLFALSAVSHKVSFVFAILATFLFAIHFVLILLKKCSNQKVLLVVKIAFAVIFGTVGIFLVYFFRRQSPRFMNAFSLPFVNLKNCAQLLNYVGFAGVIEIGFYALALYAFAIFKREFLPAVLVLALYFPFWNLGQDMASRMLLNAVPLGLPLFLWFLNDFFAGKLSRSAVKKLIFTVSGLSFILLFFTPNLYNPKKDPPYSYYRRVVKNIELDDDCLLIAHLGLNHVYTYYKGLKDALNWLPDFYMPLEKTWRIAYGVDSERIKSVFGKNEFAGFIDDLVQQIDSRYVLIREDLWQAYLAREESEISETLKNWFNPHEVRPNFIRRKKTSRG